MENIYPTIRGRTKSPRTIESNSKDPLSAAYIEIYRQIDRQIIYVHILSKYPTPQKKYLNYDRMVIVCSDWHFHEQKGKWMETTNYQSPSWHDCRMADKNYNNILKHPRDTSPRRSFLWDHFHQYIPRPPTLIDKIDKEINNGKHISHNQRQN